MPIPEESRPAVPQNPYQFLKGEAAAVAQQRDEGSFALSPVGTGTLSGAGAVAPGAGTASPLPACSPHCRGVLAAPVTRWLRLLHDQRGLQGQLLLCKSQTARVRLGVHGCPPTPKSPVPPPPPPSLTPGDVQGAQAEQAALGLAGRLGWSRAQLLTRPAANVWGVSGCTPLTPTPPLHPQSALAQGTLYL